MSTPTFWVIGAQKCGTTTLFEDLRLQPGVALAEKESSLLLGGRLTRDELEGRYARAFHGREGFPVRGEVSTRYAMLPENPEAAANARLVAPEAQVVYLVREPVARVVSHHHHDYALHLVGADINSAVESHPPLLDNTRYATQLGPWCEAFGRDRVRVIRLEDYVARRRELLQDLLRWLGSPGDVVDPGVAAHNAATDKRIAPGGWARVRRSAAYRRLRPLVPGRARARLTRLMLPGAPPRPAPPRPETVRSVIAELRPEVDELARMVGAPFWDLDESFERHQRDPER